MNPKNNDKYPSNDHQLNILQPQTAPSRLFTILRRLIPFAMIWVSLVLMFGVICMYTNAMGQDEFYRFIFFLHNPIVVALNSLALLIALLHSILWFNSTSKIASLSQGNQKSRAWLISAGLWIVTIAISIYLLLLVLK
ncbi:hypothetical protein A9G13_04195 [Gilliamella sp. wkB178]|uniref:hypothetical protein n=1 Tax=Gilliamella sp. wkB178 TaxID=3120259 RepID=UPI00080DB278|nr:hypothetical protein [Gilliamella apicola]OCG07448.1 hypothetical protein A9G13_04195 [Gilliamella apicola]